MFVNVKAVKGANLEIISSEVIKDQYPILTEQEAIDFLMVKIKNFVMQGYDVKIHSEV